MAEKNEDGNTCTLKEDENFSMTDRLDGEDGALNEFFSKIGQRKGFHVAIICREKPDSEKDLFDQDKLKCQSDNCFFCTVKKIIRISKVKMSDLALSSDHKCYQEGCYWECKIMSKTQSSILGVFQEMIDCLAELEKDTERANGQLNALRAVDENFNNKHLDVFMSELSESMFSPDDIKKGCACISLLLILPEWLFEEFNGCCCPIHIEYVVKGQVLSAKSYVEQNKELKATKKELRREIQINQDLIKAQGTREKSDSECYGDAVASTYNFKEVSFNRELPIYSRGKSDVSVNEGYEEHNTPMPRTGRDNPPIFDPVDKERR